MYWSSPPRLVFSDKLEWSWSLMATHFLQPSKSCCRLFLYSMLHHAVKMQVPEKGSISELDSTMPYERENQFRLHFISAVFIHLWPLAPFYYYHLGNLSSTCTISYSSFPDTVLSSESKVCCSKYSNSFWVCYISFVWRDAAFLSNPCIRFLLLLFLVSFY